MMKRFFAIALAAGLFASVAFTAPANAAPTTVTTVGAFALTPGTATATAWDFVYTNAGGLPLASITSLVIDNAGGLTLGVPVITVNATTSDILFTFTAANATTGSPTPLVPGLKFHFDTTNAPSDVRLAGYPLTFTGATDVNSHAAITAASVPEPASLALLGIGMTGFLAFRRYFKKTSVA